MFKKVYIVSNIALVFNRSQPLPRKARSKLKYGIDVEIYTGENRYSEAGFLKEYSLVLKTCSVRLVLLKASPHQFPVNAASPSVPLRAACFTETSGISAKTAAVSLSLTLPLFMGDSR